VQCKLTYLCLPSSRAVPRHLVEQVSAAVLWKPPQINGGVAWNVRVELGPEQAEDDSLEHAQTFLGEPVAQSSLQRIVFPHQAGRYCVTLVLENLRSGQEVA
jgi:hypothetical protein